MLATLRNRRFRLLLLGLILLVEIPGFFLILVTPIVHSRRLPDDFVYYVQASQMLAQGDDPYQGWLHDPTVDRSRVAGYIYPPLLAWTMQPLLPFLDLPPLQRHPNRLQVHDHYGEILGGTWARAKALEVGLILSQLVSLAVFTVAIVRSLRDRSLDMGLFVVALTVGFFPVQQNFSWGQINLLLLALGGLWYHAWSRGDSWRGGAALGLATALKLIQAPVLLLLVGSRRWRTVIGALTAIAAGSLVAAPQYLLEYYTKVLPQLGLGTGFAGNVAPLGTIARLVEPRSALIGHTQITPGVRFAALVVGLAVIAGTATAIFRARRRGGSDPTLEAAAVLSAVPLIATIDWPAHLALELLPILILFDLGLQARRTGLMVAVLVSWLIMGPVQGALWADSGERPGQGTRLIVMFPEVVPAALWLLWGCGMWALLVDFQANASRRLRLLADGPAAMAPTGLVRAGRPAD